MTDRMENDRAERPEGAPEVSAGNAEGAGHEPETARENAPGTPEEPDGIAWWRREIYGDANGGASGTQDDGGASPGSGEYWNGFQDYGVSGPENEGYGPVPEPYRSNSLTRASMICGIISIVSAFLMLGSGIPALLFGGLGIMFGLLSRDHELAKQARTGIGLSIGGIAVFGAVIAISVATLVSTGLWDYMVEEISSMDPNDPNAVAETEEKIVNALLERFGLSSGNRLLPDNMYTGEDESESAAENADSAPEDRADSPDSAAGTSGTSGGENGGETGAADGNAGRSGENPESAETGGQGLIYGDGGLFAA